MLESLTRGAGRAVSWPIRLDCTLSAVAVTGAGDGDSRCVAEGDDRWKRAVGAAGAISWLFHEAADEVIKLGARIGLVERRQGQCQHLEHLERGAGHGEGEDVLPGLEGMVFRQAFDVNRIVEQPFAL